MVKEIQDQIQEYKDTIEYYQGILIQGKEFPNGFDSKGNQETNLDIARRKVRETQNLLNKYINTMLGTNT